MIYSYPSCRSISTRAAACKLLASLFQGLQPFVRVDPKVTFSPTAPTARTDIQDSRCRNHRVGRAKTAVGTPRVVALESYSMCDWRLRKRCAVCLSKSTSRLPVDVRPLPAESYPLSPQCWKAVKQSVNTTKRTVSCCTISVPQASIHSPLCPHSTPSSQPLRPVPNNLTAGSASSTHVAQHLLHRSPNTDQAHRAHVARLRTRVKSFVSNT